MIKNFFLHLKTILIHKYWVAYYCFKIGLYWQGIVHDLSKFSPIEFWESVKYYQGDKSPLAYSREVNGYSKAWLHHRGRNKHHYEYWCDNFDYGVISLVMPYKYAVEYICDIIAAHRTYVKAFSYESLLNRFDHKPVSMRMHEGVKYFVRSVIRLLINEGESSFTSKRLKKLYSDCIIFYK